MPWAPEDGSAPGTVANALPYTLEWAAFPVNAVITGRDTYDFTKVDALLDAIASRGHRGVIRFYLDYPGRTTGMPRYLLNAGTDKSRQYDLHGNNEISFSPNDDEPAVQEMMLRFVAASARSTTATRASATSRRACTASGARSTRGRTTARSAGRIRRARTGCRRMPSERAPSRPGTRPSTTPSSRTATPPRRRRLTAWATSTIPSATQPWRARAGISCPR